MKHKSLTTFGKFLMKIDPYRICIVDDEETYFNPRMLHYAEIIGFKDIERFSIVDDKLL